MAAAGAVSPDDMRDMRKVLATWTVKRFRAWRDAEGCDATVAGGGRTILTLNHDVTIEAALSALSQRGVLSAPVVDATTGDYSGWFFTCSAVLTRILAELFPSLLDDASLVTADAVAAALAKDAGPVSSLASWAREGFLSQLIERPGATDGDIAFAGFDDTTLLDLISRGLKRGAEVNRGDFEPSHRIAIYEEQPDGRMSVVDIVSQSDCLRVLLAEKDKLGAWVSKTSVEEAFGRKPVLCVPSTLPTIAAFALMQNTDISGCGITGDGGKLVCHLTVSDLRCLTSAADFELLRLPVLQFAKLRLGGDPEAPPSPGSEKVASAQSPVVKVQPSDSVLHLMRALVDGKAHRAYVVERGAPVGVVTLTDILRPIAVDPDSKESEMLTW